MKWFLIFFNLISLSLYANELDINPFETTVTKIKVILARCDSCHQGIVPELASWPIDGSSENHEAYLKIIADVLNLEKNGKNPFMPPEGEKALTTEEISLLKNWYLNLAPNEKGNPQLKSVPWEI